MYRHEVFEENKENLTFGREFITVFDFEKLKSVETLSIAFDANFSHPNHQIIIMNCLSDSIADLLYKKIDKEIEISENDGFLETDHHFIYKYNDQIIWTNSRGLNINTQNEIVRLAAAKNGIDNPYGLWSEYYYGPEKMDERYISQSITWSEGERDEFLRVCKSSLMENSSMTEKEKQELCECKIDYFQKKGFSPSGLHSGNAMNIAYDTHDFCKEKY